jgi:hypothetical protein
MLPRCRMHGGAPGSGSKWVIERYGKPQRRSYEGGVALITSSAPSALSFCSADAAFCGSLRGNIRSGRSS